MSFGKFGSRPKSVKNPLYWVNQYRQTSRKQTQSAAKQTQSAVRKEQWEIDVTHPKLGKSRHIRGTDRDDVEQKARLQLLAWNNQWERQLDTNNKRTIKEIQKKADEAAREIVVARSAEAQDRISILSTLLQRAVTVDADKVWSIQNERGDWQEASPELSLLKRPRLQRAPKKPLPVEDPPEINLAESAYKPKISWIGRLIPGKKEDAQAEARENLNQAIAARTVQCQKIAIENVQRLVAWEDKVKAIEHESHLKLEAWESDNASIRKRYEEELEKWKGRRTRFREEQERASAAMELRHQRWLAGEIEAVEYFCNAVLTVSDYPQFFPKNWLLHYSPANRTLSIDYTLPKLRELPTLKKVEVDKCELQLKWSEEKEIESANYEVVLKDINLSEKEVGRLYEDVVYQTTFRTIYELFRSDTANAIDKIIFNGYVASDDKAAGPKAENLVVTLDTSKNEWRSLDLQAIEPKKYFQALGGTVHKE